MTPTRPLRLALALSAAFACAHAVAQAPATGATSAAAPAARSMQELLDASKPTDWRTLDPENLLVMTFGDPASDARRRAVIELAPHAAPAHVANIRTLAREGFWNGLSINRSQDGFVVQWGDPAEDEAKRRPLGSAKTALPTEFTHAAKGQPFDRLPDVDGWAKEVGFSQGFASAREGADGQAWLAHCYGVVGAGRDTAPDSSTGAELYVVIGQSPRQLDRNITTVGRVVQGMEHLSVIPRGTGPLGFYTDAAQRVPIASIALASTLPAAERPALQALRTDTPLFAELVESRRNRRDAFYVRPAGHIDLCNVPLPVREAPKG